jgi:hypothetical protein
MVETSAAGSSTFLPKMAAVDDQVTRVRLERRLIDFLHPTVDCLDAEAAHIDSTQLLAEAPDLLLHHDPLV